MYTTFPITEKNPGAEISGKDFSGENFYFLETFLFKLTCPFVRLYVCTDVCNHLYIGNQYFQSKQYMTNCVRYKNGLIGRNRFVVRVRSL
jgi:hypothetical protein